MSDSEDIKNMIDELYEKSGIDKDTHVSNIEQNFSAEDIAHISSLLSLYTPLLETSRLILKQLILMNEQNFADIPEEQISYMQSWIDDYQSLQEGMKAFHDKNTIH